jgi:hypothetical protein
MRSVDCSRMLNMHPISVVFSLAAAWKHGSSHFGILIILLPVVGLIVIWGGLSTLIFIDMLSELELDSIIVGVIQNAKYENVAM